MNKYWFLNFPSATLDVSKFLLHLFYRCHRLSALPWNSYFSFASHISYASPGVLTLAGCYVCLGPANERHLQGIRKRETKVFPWPPSALGGFSASPEWLQVPPKNPTAVFASTRCPQKSHHLSLRGFSLLQIRRLFHHPDLFVLPIISLLCNQFSVWNCSKCWQLVLPSWLVPGRYRSWDWQVISQVWQLSLHLPGEHLQTPHFTSTIET